MLLLLIPVSIPGCVVMHVMYVYEGTHVQLCISMYLR